MTTHRRASKKHIQQSRSRWSTLAMLAAVAAAVLLFISNALTVGKLLEEVDDLRRHRDKLSQENEILRARAISLQEAERIMTIAKDKLDMKEATSAPKKIAR